MRLSGLVLISEIRRLRLLVKLNFRAVLRRKQRGGLVPDGLRPRRPRRERQRPVISIVREPQQNLSRLHLRQRKLHHPPHRPNRRHRHRRAIGVAPFISHQQNCVAGGGDSGVVVALVEGAGLIGGGFGRKGGNERQAVGRKQPVQTREELRVCLCQLPAQIFKVHVQAHIALFLHLLQHRLGKRLLKRFASQHDRRLRSGKGSGCRQRRQVQKRPHAVLPCQRKQPLVVHRHERALRREAVGKRHQRPGKRQNAAQNGFLHIRIRVPADKRAARPALLQLRHENLPRIELVGAGQVRVHPE